MAEGRVNNWVKAFIVTAIFMAIVFRVPQLEKLVVGGNITKSA